MLIRILKGLTRSHLFQRERIPHSYCDIIVWWESRRIPFNLVVGATGIVSLTIVLIMAFITEHYLGKAIGLSGSPFFEILAAIAYAVMANLCFTGGWILELVSLRVWERDTEAFGEVAFLWGTLFSIALTLLPAAFVVLIGAIRLLERQ